MTDEDDAQSAALQEYFEDNRPAGYGAAFRAGWEAGLAFESSQLATPEGERLIFTNAEFCRFVTESRDMRERAEAAEAKVVRLRVAANEAGAILAATYALLSRTGDADGAARCMRILETIDAALSGQDGDRAETTPDDR